MPGIATTLVMWLPSTTAVGTLTGPGLILLAYRITGLVELRIIMQSLPAPDRVTAAVAYIGAHPSRAHTRHGTTCRCCITVSIDATTSHTCAISRIPQTKPDLQRQRRHTTHHRSIKSPNRS
jgi:hypothetical protein